MSLLVDVTVRSSVVIAAALLVFRLLHRRSAALRYAVLAGAMLVSALVVPLSWTLPAWGVRVPAQLMATHSVSARASAVISASGLVASPVGARAAEPTFQTVVVGIWGIGVAVSLAVLVLALVRLRRVASRAVPRLNDEWSRAVRDISASVGVRRPIALLQGDSPDLLATWGARQPRILLPSRADEWNDARIRAVLGHEIAHIQRNDWLVHLAAETLRAFQWFNPLFWLACRRLRQLSELACDDDVLRRGVPAREYAMHLLEVARTCRPSSIPVAVVVPMARHSTLERRIAAMLNPRTDRGPLSRRAIALTFVGLVGLALPTAAIRAAQDGPLPLAGSVYDPSGGVLPDAALTLEDSQHHTWQTTSDSQGRFTFAPVAPGTYVLSVALAGFRPLRQDTELRVARDWDRSITLQVADVQETVTVEEKRTSALPPAAAGPVRIRVGGNIRPPRRVHVANAVYPESMLKAGVEGKVPLEAIISTDGAVHSVRVLTSQVHPDLAVAAADAVRQWRFEPTLLNGKPVEVAMKVTIDFRLKD